MQVSMLAAYLLMLQNGDLQMHLQVLKDYKPTVQSTSNKNTKAIIGENNVDAPKVSNDIIAISDFSLLFPKKLSLFYRLYSLLWFFVLLSLQLLG